MPRKPKFAGRWSPSPDATDFLGFLDSVSGLEFVPVPASPVQCGIDAGTRARLRALGFNPALVNSKVCFADAREVFCGAFMISRWPLTVADVRRICPDIPQEATRSKEFARLAPVEARRIALLCEASIPSPAEWILAAAGPQPRLFAFWDEPPPLRLRGARGYCVLSQSSRAKPNFRGLHGLLSGEYVDGPGRADKSKLGLKTGAARLYPWQDPGDLLYCCPQLNIPAGKMDTACLRLCVREGFPPMSA